MESERTTENKSLFASVRTPQSAGDHVFGKKAPQMTYNSPDSNVTKKHFYYDILREIEIMKLNDSNSWF